MPDGVTGRNPDGTFSLSPEFRARLEAEGQNLTPGEQARDNQPGFLPNLNLTYGPPQFGGNNIGAVNEAGAQYNPFTQFGPSPYDPLTTTGTTPSDTWYSPAADGASSQTPGSSFNEAPSNLAGVGFEPGTAPTNNGYTPDTTVDYTPSQTTNPVFDYYPTYDYSSYSFSDTSFSDAGFDTSFPVILDLAGNGLNITPVSSSNIFFDTAGDGRQHRTAWAGAGNGVLVLDLAGTGQITQRNQVVFTDWDPTATSDLQALADVFDTNHNGNLDAGDAQFASFKIMVTNADGTTTLQTLAQAGVTSINLTPNAAKVVLTDGSTIDGQTTFTRTNGSTGTVATVATVALTNEANGYSVARTVTHNADGSTTIDNKALNPDGSVANETIGTTCQRRSKIASVDRSDNACAAASSVWLCRRRGSCRSSR